MSESVVPLKDESIRLGQFLKLADLVDTGADAKGLLASGLVRVNGEVESRRGRQLGTGGGGGGAGRRRGGVCRPAGRGGLTPTVGPGPSVRAVGQGRRSADLDEVADEDQGLA